MQREILFRGKRIDNNEWVYGLVVNSPYGHCIANDDSLYHIDGAEWNFDCCEINPNTVGQFTGLTDKNGTKIFEGDKVVYTLNHDSIQTEIVAIVEWHNHAWRLNRIWLLTEIRTINVIGNIHDNPELLNG